jgi:hypothetical protein
MMAPLMDHHGETRYFIGAQIDISHLVEGGKGLESFKQLLDQEQDAVQETLRRLENPNPIHHKPSLRLLRELSGLLNDEEIEVVSHRERCRSSTESSVGTAHTPMHANSSTQRRFVGMDEPTDDVPSPVVFGPSGKLPGVYQNVRSPSSHCKLMTNNNPVPPRPTVPISTHHLHFRRPPHPGSVPI